MKSRFPGVWKALKDSLHYCNATPQVKKEMKRRPPDGPNPFMIESPKICRVGRRSHWQLASTQVMVIRTLSYMQQRCVFAVQYAV